jgi:hypothetical protein
MPRSENTIGPPNQRIVRRNPAYAPNVEALSSCGGDLVGAVVGGLVGVAASLERRYAIFREGGTADPRSELSEVPQRGDEASGVGFDAAGVDSERGRSEEHTSELSH